MTSASVRVLCVGLFLFIWFSSFTTNVHAEDQFLYTNDDRNNGTGASTVSAFRVGASGSLTALPGSPFSDRGNGL